MPSSYWPRTKIQKNNISFSPLAQEKTGNHSHLMQNGAIYKEKAEEAAMSEPDLEEIPGLFQRKRKERYFWQSEESVCLQVQWQVRCYDHLVEVRRPGKCIL